MIGHVTDSNTRIWMQLSNAAEVKIRPIDADTQQSLGEITLDVPGPYPFICDAPVNGLQANHNYRIDILVDDKPVDLRPLLNVRTAPAQGDAVNFKVAFGSCIDLSHGGKMPIFAAIQSQAPQAFFFLGNNGTLPAKLDDYPPTRRKALRFFCDFHRSIRNLPDLQGLMRSSAIYGLWDDGDFGPPNPDKTFVYAKESQAAFQRYWANPNYGTPEAPGVYHTFSIGDVDFFMLDNRMFRDPPTAPEPKTMLGAAQMDWLKKNLLSSRGAFKIIACPTPMLASYPDESWSNFKQEHDDFIAWIFEHKIGGIIFLSGHRHLAELTCRQPTAKNGPEYPLYELTSSALADSPPTAAAQNTPNPLRIGDPFLDANFGVLEFSGPQEKRHVNLLLRDESGKIRLTPTTLFAGNLKGAE